MQASDLKCYRANSLGRCSATQINSGVVANVFPHVSSAERASGKTDYAHTFWKVADTANGTLIDPELYHDKPTLAAGDYAVICLLSRRVLPAGLAAAIEAADKAGSGILAVNIADTDLTIQVDVKHANLLPGGTDEIFYDGAPVKICSHSDALASDGTEIVRTISGTPTYTGLRVTMTFTEAVGVAFTANGVTRVSSLLQPADVTTSATDPVIAIGSGTTDHATYPIELDHIGTVDEDWQADFTDATHFTVTGDSVSGSFNGTKGVELVMTNPDFSRPYQTIPAGFFNGTFAPGDRVTWTTRPADVPVGQKRVVVAGATSLANNRVTQVLGGEAA